MLLFSLSIAKEPIMIFVQVGSELDWEEERVVMTDRQGRTDIQMVEQVLANKHEILL